MVPVRGYAKEGKAENVELVGITAQGEAGPARLITEISRNAHWLIKTERRPASDPSAPHRQAYRARRKRSNPCCITSPGDVGWRSCWQS